MIGVKVKEHSFYAMMEKAEQSASKNVIRFIGGVFYEKVQRLQ